MVCVMCIKSNTIWILTVFTFVLALKPNVSPSHQPTWIGHIKAVCELLFCTDHLLFRFISNGWNVMRLYCNQIIWRSQLHRQTNMRFSLGLVEAQFESETLIYKAYSMCYIWSGEQAGGVIDIIKHKDRCP